MFRGQTGEGTLSPCAQKSREQGSPMLLGGACFMHRHSPLGRRVTSHTHAQSRCLLLTPRLRGRDDNRLASPFWLLFVYFTLVLLLFPTFFSCFFFLDFSLFRLHHLYFFLCPYFNWLFLCFFLLISVYFQCYFLFLCPSVYACAF